MTGLRTLSDKYYLNKLTGSINISQEYLGDDDILELWNQFKELQTQRVIDNFFKKDCLLLIQQMQNITKK